MAKLYFFYGTMGSSKTVQAHMSHHNYKERKNSTIFMQPAIADRKGAGISESRIGTKVNVDVSVKAGENIKELIEDQLVNGLDVIFIDEAEFLTAKQVNELSDIAIEFDVPVLCYGLRTDFRGDWFEGSEALMKIADKITEIKTTCWCGKKATMNARLNAAGDMVVDGEQVAIGYNYIGLCREHFLKRQPHDTK